MYAELIKVGFFFALAKVVVLNKVIYDKNDTANYIEAFNRC